MDLPLVLKEYSEVALGEIIDFTSFKNNYAVIVVSIKNL